MKTTIIAATTAVVLGFAGSAFANENENGVSMYIPNGQGAFAQQVQVRQPARTITDSERVWLERSSKDIGAY